VPYANKVQAGNMVLCRVNAPLVSECFRYIKDNRKANIQGRDVGAGLISTVKKMKAHNVLELIAKLDDWRVAEIEKENQKRNPNEQRIINLNDKCDCIMCFTEGVKTIPDVIQKIQNVFTDDKKSPGIRLSSIHRSKGLESDRVFLLQPRGATVPHPSAQSDWQLKQEWNLLYVAITRAKLELCHVK
jgi:superfamily I DNA/RNA helicase